MLALTSAYGLTIAGLAALLLRIGIGAKKATLVGFLVFGILSGSLAAQAWPLDSCTYLNLYAVLLGDMVYLWAIRYLGDVVSAQAHYTIPWVLQVPQVYAATSIALSLILGLFCQWLVGVRTSRSH